MATDRLATGTQATIPHGLYRLSPAREVEGVSNVTSDAGGWQLSQNVVGEGPLSTHS